MIHSYRARAPLRLGLGGGGTDVSPYSDRFGGCILNATIDLFSYCSISPRSDNKIHFVAADRNEEVIGLAESAEFIEESLPLHKAVYKKIVNEFNNKKPLPCNILTYSDAPAGSGLGTSSTMVVAILGAFKEWLNLPLGEYEIARLAFEIERVELQLAGGKQDQYSATFGGFNFMEFSDQERVIVNPLRVTRSIVQELQHNLLLYYTGSSRESSKIIAEQIKNVEIGAQRSLDAMHAIKENAILMKEYLLKGDLNSFATALNHSWEAKKNMSSIISNNRIDAILDKAKKAGAIAGKVSGAGGGGYIMFMVDPCKRALLVQALSELEGSLQRFQFTSEGLETWCSKQYTIFDA